MSSPGQGSPPPHKQFLQISDGDASGARTPSGDSSGALTRQETNGEHMRLDNESNSGSDESLEKGERGGRVDSEPEDSVVDTHYLEPSEGASSLTGASANFVNTVIGVGIITLGQTLKVSGVYFGIFLMVACVALTGYTSWLMIATGLKCKKGTVVSYGSLCRVTLGEGAFLSLSFMNFFMMLGVLMSYAIVFRQVMGEFVSSIMREQFQYDWALLLAVAVVVMLPLSLLKDMSKLAFSSVVSSVMVLLIVTLVCVRAPVYHHAMVAMTPKNMVANELTLKSDRAQFVCEYARTFLATNEFQSVFTVLPERKIWPDTKNMKLRDSDVKKLYSAVAAGGHCASGSVNTVEVQRIMDAMPITENMAGTSNVTVSKSISEAHANKLYAEWSLNADEGFKEHTFARPGAFVALGVFGSAFITQQVVFSIYNSLRVRTIGQWQKVVVASSGIITTFCLALSVVGFFCFQYQSRGQVFETMKPRFLGMEGDIATNIAQSLLLATIALTYPMQLFSGRVSATEMFEKLCAHQGWTTAREHPNRVHNAVSLCMWGLSVLVGLFVDDMVYVFGMIGALFASPMIYILPVLAHFGQQGGIMAAIRSESNNKSTRTFCWEVVLPMFVLAFGVVIVLLTPIFTTTEKFQLTDFEGKL